MDYHETDKHATHRAYAVLGVGKWLPVQTGRRRGRVVLVPFDGLKYRTLDGQIIPGELLHDTEQGARDALDKALSTHPGPEIATL